MLIGIVLNFVSASECTGLNCDLNMTIKIIDTTASTEGSGGSGRDCSTKWACTEWNTCSTAGTQTRTCSYPATNCKPAAVKPIESQSCNYLVSSTNAYTGETIPEGTIPEGTATSTGFFGMTGAVIGNLTSPKEIGMIILIVIVLAGGVFFLIKNDKKKKSESKPLNISSSINIY